MTTYTFSDDEISCLHKSAYGFRPGTYFFAEWKSMTPDQKQTEWDRLVDVMGEREKQREEEEKIAMTRFEKLVEKTINAGASDRETALRWIMDGSDCDGDWEFLCYHHGLPYSYFRSKQVAEFA